MVLSGLRSAQLTKIKFSTTIKVKKIEKVFETYFSVGYVIDFIILMSNFCENIPCPQRVNNNSKMNKVKKNRQNSK